MVELTGTNGFFFDFCGFLCMVVVGVLLLRWCWCGCGVLICGSGFWVVVLQWRHGAVVVGRY